MYKTMTSPSPTQAPPTQTPPPTVDYKPVLRSEDKPALPEEPKPVRTTPLKRRPGATRTARIIKGILRPPIKVLYYLSSWIKKHKLSSLAIILLLVASTSATAYYLTGESPVSGSQQQDPFHFPFKGGKGEGDLVKSWLYALRDGDVVHLQLLDKDMPQPPDPMQLVTQFSQTKTHLIWGEGKVTGVDQQPDTTIDSFVQIPVSANGPGTTLKGLMLWHFVTASLNGRDVLLSVDMVSLRALEA
jgi:hypothetical protein